jgi:hypothetical protein
MASPSFDRLTRRLCGVGAVIAVLMGPGCVSADLSKDAKANSQVAECLPPGTPAPTMIASAIWFPNASGFGSSDETGMGHLQGVLALAGDKLWFMTWNDTVHQYDMQHVVDFVPAMKVDIEHALTATMLVIQSGNRSFDGFELMNGGRLGSDAAATQDLYGKIEAIRARHPQTDS